MIKKKQGINRENAFRNACKINDIELTPKNTNKSPVAYIDNQGKKVYLGKESLKKTEIWMGEELGMEVSVKGKVSTQIRVAGEVPLVAKPVNRAVSSRGMVPVTVELANRPASSRGRVAGKHIGVKGGRKAYQFSTKKAGK